MAVTVGLNVRSADGKKSWFCLRGETREIVLFTQNFEELSLQREKAVEVLY